MFKFDPKFSCKIYVLVSVHVLLLEARSASQFKIFIRGNIGTY